METPLSQPSEVTPHWLTRTLRAAGILAHESVEHVEIESLGKTGAARHTRLTLSYEGAGEPAKLYLKLALEGERSWLVRQEASFYSTVAHGAGELPIPKCFHAAESATGAHVLLEDLESTHRVASCVPLPPSVELCEEAVRTWASIHATWWNHPRLAEVVGAGPSEAMLQELLQQAPVGLAAFLDHLGDRISTERRNLYSRVLEALPRIYRSVLLEGTPHTLVHGDAHVWNLMFPRDPGRHAVMAIDWQTWNVMLSVADLAYMMALHWYPERRRQHERALLSTYHEALVDRGVADYSWDACLLDYRHCVLLNLLIPPRQWHVGINPRVWWSHLERSFLAFEALECEELMS